MQRDENGQLDGRSPPSRPADEGEERGPGGGLRAEISRGIVQIHKDTFGKGPTRARTYFDRDLVVCVLGGAMTRAERTLADGGRERLVIEQRAAWQELMR